MSAILTWVFLVFAFVLVLTGIRRLRAWLRRRSRVEPEIDDDAIARILAQGTIGSPEDAPLDEDEIARAEAEFWDESWDEPEEYGR